MIFCLLRNDSPLPHSTLTETLGGPVAPLGAAGLTVVAREDGTTGQYKTLVTDILHGGPHRKFGARYEASAVLHIPRIMAGSHYRERVMGESSPGRTQQRPVHPGFAPGQPIIFLSHGAAAYFSVPAIWLGCLPPLSPSYPLESINTGYLPGRKYLKGLAVTL